MVLDNSVEAWNERPKHAQPPWEAASFSKRSQDLRYGAVLLKLANRIKSRDTLLDYGCGFGRFSSESEWDYTGYDHSPEMVARAKVLYSEHKFTSNVKEL